MNSRFSSVVLKEYLGAPPPRGRTKWLVRSLLSLIAEGRLPSGVLLPSERKIAEELGLSRGTVVRALDEVAGRGFIVSRQGSGRAVSVPGWSDRPFEPIEADPQVAATTSIDLRAAVLPPHPDVRMAAGRVMGDFAGDTTWGSSSAEGLPVLVDAVCRHYESRGLPTSRDQVLITNGAVSAVHLSLLALTVPGSRVGIENPGYPNTARAIRAAGRVPFPIDVCGSGPAESNGHGKSIRLAVDSGAVQAAVLTLDFHNPTGHLIRNEERAQILHTAAARHAPLIIDETLVGMNWRGGAMPPPYLGRGPVVLVGSASKSLWAGLRIGWIRSSRRIVDVIRRVRLGVDLGAPPIEQRIAAALVPELRADGVPAHARRIADQFSALSKALEEKLPHWQWIEPAGGLSIWCTGLRRDATRVVRDAADAGVVLSPGSTFSPTGRGWTKSVRVPFTLASGDLVRAVDVLADMDF